MRLKTLLVCGMATLFLSACGPEKQKNENIPPITSRVMDTANVLNAWQRSSLISNLTRLDKNSKIEAVFYTLKRLPENESLEEYTNKVFNTWKIGKKGTDTGLLVLNVIDEKKIRIEVGRGNEGNIPDMLANRIIRDSMVKYLARGMYYEAYQAAIHDFEKLTKEGK